MLRRSMHAWRSTWLLHTRAVLLQVVLVSELASSTFVTYFYFPAPPQSRCDADWWSYDKTSTKASGDPRHTKSAGRRRAICSWQVAATNSHNLSGSLATRFFFYFSPSHFCCGCMHQHWTTCNYLMAQQPNLPIWKSTKPNATPVHPRYLLILRSKRNLRTLPTLRVEAPTTDHLRDSVPNLEKYEAGLQNVP